MVDLATLRRVAMAIGGTRGDIVRTTPDGRVLLSQSNQIDVLSPLQAPRVARTSPPGPTILALPTNRSLPKVPAWLAETQRRPRVSRLRGPGDVRLVQIPGRSERSPV